MSAARGISTVIATYDRPQFLVDALNCLAVQTRQPREVIVVDDGSGPETRHALEQWRLCTERGTFALRYLRQRNSGPAVARNRGVAESRGDLIHFMDDDDLMAPDALQHLATALAGIDGAAVAMASYALLHHDGYAAPAGEPAVTPGLCQSAQVLAAMIAGQWFVPVHGYLFTREAIARMGPWDASFSSQEDDEFLFRAVLEGVEFLPAPEALVYYRQHGGVRRATPGKPGETLLQGLRKRLRDDLAIREQVFRELRTRGVVELHRAAFHAWHERLVERYDTLLPELEAERWAVLPWLGHAGREVPVALRDSRAASPLTLRM